MTTLTQALDGATPSRNGFRYAKAYDADHAETLIAMMEPSGIIVTRLYTATSGDNGIPLAFMDADSIPVTWESLHN
jgi:hypothetical protein